MARRQCSGCPGSQDCRDSCDAPQIGRRVDIYVVLQAQHTAWAWFTGDATRRKKAGHSGIKYEDGCERDHHILERGRRHSQVLVVDKPSIESCNGPGPTDAVSSGTLYIYWRQQYLHGFLDASRQS